MNRIGEAIRPINNHLHIQFEREWLDSFQNRLQQDQWDDWTCYRLAMEAAEARTIHSFDDLLCLRQQLNIQPLPHQLDTARNRIHQIVLPFSMRLFARFHNRVN